MLRDPDDEMVRKAAVQGGADRLLTFNLRDFVGAERLGMAVERPGTADYFRERAARARPAAVEALLASFGDDAPPLEGDEVA